MTVTVQIGNSDDKLTQARWSIFFAITDEAIRSRAKTVYFGGASHPAAAWQNAAWVFDAEEENLVLLRRELARICQNFNQDSIAWTQGDTEFVGAA